MSIWERLASAVAQSSVGASIGTLFGGAGGAAEVEREPLDRSADNEVPFTVGVIALSAKMAKADGVITRDEVKAFKEAFRVSDGEMKHVARIFNLAKEDVTGYEDFAEDLVNVFKGNRELLEDVLEGLFHIAKADEILHPQEEQFLRNVAKRFGLTDTEFNYIKARNVAATERNPYDVLGVNPSVSNDELKSHYRRLIADNNPDRLLARGVPKEFITIANTRVVAIDAAYDAIVKQRSG
jgi:DnaJ like chaperone protein